MPLFLSAKTQEIFSLRVDKDITRDSPIVLVKKELIIADIKMRAGVSDFSEVKQIVLVCVDCWCSRVSSIQIHCFQLS